jgi:hypothetical protein
MNGETPQAAEKSHPTPFFWHNLWTHVEGGPVRLLLYEDREGPRAIGLTVGMTAIR